MKKIIFSSLAIASLAFFSFTRTGELPIGAEMPKADVKMKDVSGKEISLKDAMKKNGLLVMFSCNTCPYVIKNQDRTKEVSAYASDKNIGVVIVNSNEAQRDNADSYEAMKDYAKEQGYKWHYVVDKNSALADAFGANRTPETFLFDSKGKLVQSQQNRIGAGNNQVQVDMKSLPQGNYTMQTNWGGQTRVTKLNKN